MLAGGEGGGFGIRGEVDWVRLFFRDVLYLFRG